MKVAVLGSRSIQDAQAKEWLFKNIEILQVSEIISGGTPHGVGQMVREIAEETQIRLIEILPLYSKYGKAAPIIRNKEVIQNADCVLAVWDGRSKGTKNEIEMAQKMGKNIKIWCNGLVSEIQSLI